MRILWFTNVPILSHKLTKPGCFAGGWLDSMASHLIRRENIQFAVSFYSDRNAEPYIESGISFFPLYRDPERLSWLNMRKYLNSDKGRNDNGKFLSFIESFQPDIIHIHGTELPFGKLIGHTDIPAVISIQGIITVYHHMFYRGISKSEFKKHVTFKERVRFADMESQQNLFGYKAKLEIEILGRCRYIIGRTDWDRRVCSVLSPGSDYFHNDEILRNPFYLTEWTYRNSEIHRIYTTTGNSAYKGLETIIETADLLKHRKGFKFLWRIGGVSESDDVVKFCLKKYGKSFPSDHVIFLGRIDANAIISEMLEASIYVMPSHIENSSNSLCEAMLTGMPVVATYAGGTGSLLDDGSEGVLIQDGDPWSMAGAIFEITGSKTLSVKYGNNARRRALERHNPDRNINELISIYKKIISKHSKNESN